MDRKRAHYALHHVWTKAVGTANYDKADWRELEGAIHELERLVKDAAIRILSDRLVKAGKDHGRRASAVEKFCGDVGINLLDVIEARLRPALRESAHKAGCLSAVSMSLRCSCGGRIDVTLDPDGMLGHPIADDGAR